LKERNQDTSNIPPTNYLRHSDDDSSLTKIWHDKVSANPPTKKLQLSDTTYIYI